MTVKNDTTLAGVKCEVRDCVYHCMTNDCAAPSIKVSCNQTSADCKSDTVCDTFRKNSVSC